ncbi:MAG: CAP domain-containing protein [Hydrogenophaga sp.]|nr:CAP domain-containing protein [Hydrogenophaga sp.]
MALLTACGGGDISIVIGSPSVRTEPCPVGNLSSAAVTAINNLRAQAQVCGGVVYPAAAPLSWDSRLAQAATGHSIDMAANSFFSHTGSNGSGVGARVSATGYAWSSVAENIAAGQSSLSGVMGAWMNSAGHCENIMRASSTQFALACERRVGTGNTPYWTLVLARP